jgi:hypothetical protein
MEDITVALRHVILEQLQTYLTFVQLSRTLGKEPLTMKVKKWMPWLW